MNSKFVVGIGASAGGLTDLKKFVKNLNKGTGISYVIVQHLDPSHDSILHELLSRETALPVYQASHGQKVQPDTIYVIKPGTFLAIEKNKLIHSSAEDIRGSRRAVDHFFLSLSQECGRLCVGVILSGAGNDGTAGLRVIQAEGRLTIAQDPSKAEHSNMPQSAIDAGVVDMVLPIEEMPEAIQRLRDHPYLKKEESEPEEPEEILSQINILLKTHENFNLHQYKTGTVQRRIIRRMSLTGVEQYSKYTEKLREDASERASLIKDLMINVTDFFRDPEAFEIIEDQVFPEMLNNVRRGEEIRLWIAGCATGEEAYSLAIVLQETLAKYGKKNEVKIFATDIDDEAIKIARRGLYPKSISAEIPSVYLDKYFVKHDTEYYQIKRQIRDQISFAIQNVATDPPFSQMHFISCRNLLIYLTKEVQKQVLDSIYFSLKLKGHLFLGSAETIGTHGSSFKTLSKKWRVYQKISDKPESPFILNHLRVDDKRANFFRTKSRVPTDPLISRTDSLRRDILHSLLSPTVVIDAEGHTLYNHGDLKPYLNIPEGEPHNDFFRSVIPIIRSRLRSSVYKVRKSEESINFHFIHEQAGGMRKVLVETSRLQSVTNSYENAICITFRIDNQNETPITLAPQDDGKAVLDLEQELAETKEELQNTIEELETSSEELKASHEEALSTNEELQSANEELEASSEELRSLNEELRTVNDQLKEKIDQLQSFNNDLTNFFESTDIPTIFLDENLKIKKYTPAAEQLLKMGPSDIDKPIESLGRDLLDGDLISESKEVLLNFKSITSEKQTEDKRWFMRRITPYRTEDRRIEGVVIVLQEVTRIKSLSQRAESREKQQEAVAKLGLLAMGGIDAIDLMHQAVRQVAHTLNADFCKILHHEPKQSQFRMIAGVGWKEGSVGSATVPDSQSSQAGYTLLSSEPVIVPNIEQEIRFQAPELLKDHFVTSGISCTIKNGDTPFGVLGVHTKTHRAFTEDDATFLLSVSHLISATLRTRQAQNQLYTSEEKFRTMANAIPQLAWIAGTEGAIEWYNDRWYEFTGSSFEQMKGWGWQQVHHPDYVEKVTDKFKTSIVNEENWEDTFPLRRQDGEYCWFLSRARPIKDKEGNVVKWFGTNTDITRELEAKKALEESEQKLRIAKDSSNIGAFEYHLTKERTDWDDILKEIWGIPEDKAATQEDFWNGVHPEDQEMVKKSIDIAMKSDYGRYHCTYRVINLTNQKLSWVEASGQVLVDDLGRPEKMIGMVIDITENKEMENSLKDAIIDLEVNDRKKNEFLATLGHELRNPLAAICGAVQLLEYQEAELPKFKGLLTNNVQRISTLLNDLLDITCITKGKVLLNKEPLNIYRVLKMVTESMQPVLDQKDQKLSLLADNEDWYISGDLVRIEQVFTNLLSNASKFSKVNGQIAINIKRANSDVLIQVKDDGRGIKSEDLERIFEPFEQAGGFSDAGLGIGLAIVKQFIAMHHGEVTAFSQGLDKGAAFTVRLPVALGHHTGTDRSAQRPILKKGIRVLLVDDNEDAVLGLQVTMEKAGCVVQMVTSAQEALELVYDFKPEVLILDTGLPDMDGYELIGAIKQIYTNPALFIAHTGFGHEVAKKMSAQAGYDYHLNKPVDYVRLWNILRTIEK